jgi:hypothetical protein
LWSFAFELVYFLLVDVILLDREKTREKTSEIILGSGCFSFAFVGARSPWIVSSELVPAMKAIS